MPYTDRQLACLSAMGLVAWGVRDGGAFVRGAPDGGAEMAAESESAADTEAADADASGGASAVVSRVGTPVEASGGAGGVARPGDDVFDAWPGTEPVPEGETLAPASAAPSPIGGRAASSSSETSVASVPSEGSAASAPAGNDMPDDAATAPPKPSAESADSPNVDPDETPAAGTDVALPAGAEPLAAPALATPLPREPAALAAWLPDQPLASFVWKERRLTRIGRDDAPLLVVVEREPSEALPLTGDAAVLFERMLGAIGRTRRDTCQCVLASAPEPEGDTVAALAGDARPATLVLLHELDGALDANGCRLPGDPFGGGAWCLPHPERLLAEPAGKRQAWLVLKAVRERLAGRAW